MRLMVIWGSSREGRNGGVVAEWVRRHAAADKRFEIEFVDLQTLKLPFFDEPVRLHSIFCLAKDANLSAGQCSIED